MSPASTAFIFKIGQPAVVISDRDPQWSLPLPISRQSLGVSRQTGDDSRSVTYGDYFCAAGDFISQHLPAILAQASGGIETEAAFRRQASSVIIHLVKHGAFYHPARVVLQTGDHQVAAVLNVAVEKAGRDVLFLEAGILERLTGDFPDRYVPTVYAHGFGMPPGGPPLAMFAACWFDGFHEFHCTRGPGPIVDRFVVWDGNDSPTHLSRVQTARLFRCAAAILTYYYNPFTFEAILNWHHAAGDFVLHKRHGTIDVRLITVRRYAPFLVVPSSQDVALEDVLDAAALFLLNISLRLRLDRIDGVDELVWIDGYFLDAVWQGFVEGLRRMAAVRELPAEFVEGVVRYAAAHSHRDWMQLGSRVLEQYGCGADEAALIQGHLSEHVTRLSALIRNQA
jgi:hypothetical protein